MTLSRIALVVAILIGVVYAVGALVTALFSGFMALVIVPLLAIAGYLLYRVVRDRLTNAEDNYYERNVDR